MTREEAILKWIIPAIKNTWNEKKCNEIIKAISAEPCEDCQRIIKPNPYYDCISRQNAIDVMWQELDEDTAHKVRDILETQPPVTPKLKTESEIHCNCTDAEIAKSFIEDVEAVKELLPQAESEEKE